MWWLPLRYMKITSQSIHCDKIMRVVALTDEEAKDLAKTIAEAIGAFEDTTPIRPSWTDEARDWALLLLDRASEG